MYTFARFEKVTAKDASAMWAYADGHLRSTKERSDLSPGTGLKPWMPNPDLWRQVGYDGDPNGPSRDLLAQLMAGRDHSGKRLTAARKDYRPPLELVFAAHAEVSHGLLLLGPSHTDYVLKRMTAAVVQKIEQNAVRVMRKGESHWEPAQCLIEAYPHHHNRIHDPHAHGHIDIYAPALCQDGTWKTYDNGACVRAMSGEVRPALTEAMIGACGDLGIKVTVNRALARDEGRFPSGAEVVLPSGLVIPAGSLSRPRSADIRADRELKAALGTLPLTARQLAWVLESPGARPEDMPRPGDRNQFCLKLADLGLLDPTSRRVLDPLQLHEALHTVTRKMATAQVQLEAFRHLPGERAGGAVLVSQQREHLCKAIGVMPGPQRREAADVWVEQALEALGTLPGAPQPVKCTHLKSFDPSVKRLFHRHAQRAGLVRYEGSNHGPHTKPILRGAAMAALDRLTFGLRQLVPHPRPVPRAIDQDPKSSRVHAESFEPPPVSGSGHRPSRTGSEPSLRSSRKAGQVHRDHDLPGKGHERYAGTVDLNATRARTGTGTVSASRTRDPDHLGARMAATFPAKGRRPSPDQRIPIPTPISFPIQTTRAVPLRDLRPPASSPGLSRGQRYGPGFLAVPLHQGDLQNRVGNAPGRRVGHAEPASHSLPGHPALDGASLLPHTGPRTNRDCHERSLRNIEAAALQWSPVEPGRPPLPAPDRDRSMRALRLGFNGIQMLKYTMKSKLTVDFDTYHYDQRQQELDGKERKRKKPGRLNPATPWDLPRQELFTARAESTPSPHAQAPQPRLPGR